MRSERGLGATRCVSCSARAAVWARTIEPRTKFSSLRPAIGNSFRTSPLFILPKGNEDEAKLAKQFPPDAMEVFDNLSWDPNSDDYFRQRLHETSSLITIKSKEDGGSEGGVDATTIQPLAGGADSATVTVDDYKGVATADEPTGLAGLGEVEEISIICAPNENSIEGLSSSLIEHCENHNRFAILQASKNAGDIAGLYPCGGKQSSAYAAFYYPWVVVNDPALGFPKEIPPGGHIAGIYARSDITRGGAQGSGQ